MDGSNPDRTCNQVPEMLDVKYAHVAMWDESNGEVLCCGGLNGDLSQYKRCFKYSSFGWTDLGDILLYERSEAGAAKLSDGRYWISGSYHGYRLVNPRVVPVTCPRWGESLIHA